ncbi:MAG: DUF6557 family protein [Gammaproteobacteria bacterium]
MTLAELIADTKWAELKAALAWLYPDESARLGHYRSVLRELRKLEPEADSMRIAIERTPGFEPDEEPAMEVIGRNGELNRELDGFTHWDERAQAEHGAAETTWSLAFRPWRAWLGMTIEPATLAAHSPAHVVAHCLYEMTFHGFCEATIQYAHQELQRRVAELDGLSAEEKAEKLIPFEQVMAELRQEMGD